MQYAQRIFAVSKCEQQCKGCKPLAPPHRVGERGPAHLLLITRPQVTRSCLIKSQAAFVTAAVVTARSHVIPCKCKTSLPLTIKPGLWIVENRGRDCAHRSPHSVSEEEIAIQDKLTELATMGSSAVQHIVTSQQAGLSTGILPDIAK